MKQFEREQFYTIDSALYISEERDRSSDVQHRQLHETASREWRPEGRRRTTSRLVLISHGALLQDDMTQNLLICVEIYYAKTKQATNAMLVYVIMLRSLANIEFTRKTLLEFHYVNLINFGNRILFSRKS
jgi:hypothetical protein